MNSLPRIFSRRFWAARLGIGFVIAGLLAACAPSQQAPEAPTPTVAVTPTLAIPASAATPLPTAAATSTPAVDFLALPTLARGYLTTPNELRRIAALARAGAEPYKSAVKAELGYAKDALGQDAPRVPNTLKFDDDI